MSGVEALARVLAANNYGTLPNMARAILADPAPLLAALAEAGVLREERTVTLDANGAGTHNGVWLHTSPRETVRRYVTKWEPIP